MYVHAACFCILYRICLLLTSFYCSLIRFCFPFFSLCIIFFSSHSIFSYKYLNVFDLREFSLSVHVIEERWSLSFVQLRIQLYSYPSEVTELGIFTARRSTKMCFALIDCGDLSFSLDKLLTQDF